MTEKPDLEDVLSHYGVVGRRRMVSCPLHPDKTPSCSINYGQGVWHCHSCGEGGDSWTLIMKMEEVNWIGAREIAQANFGIGEGGSQKSDERMVGSSYGGRRVFGRTGDRRDRRTYRRPWRGAG